MLNGTHRVGQKTREETHVERIFPSKDVARVQRTPRPRRSIGEERRYTKDQAGRRAQGGLIDNSVPHREDWSKRGRRGRDQQQNNNNINHKKKTTRTTENEGNVTSSANNNDNNTIIMNKTK